MSTWKQAVMFASLGMGAMLLLKGRRNAGIASATLGLVVLASEYPDQFEKAWDRAPEYVSRGMQVIRNLSSVAGTLAEQAAERSSGVLREITEYRR